MTLIRYVFTLRTSKDYTYRVAAINLVEALSMIGLDPGEEVVSVTRDNAIIRVQECNK